MLPFLLRNHLKHKKGLIVWLNEVTDLLRKADFADLRKTVSGTGISQNHNSTDTEGCPGFLQQLSEPVSQQGRRADGAGAVHVRKPV